MNTPAGAAASHIGPDGCSKAERRPIHVVQTAQPQEGQNLGFYRVKHQNCSKQQAARVSRRQVGKEHDALGSDEMLVRRVWRLLVWRLP